MSSLQEMGAYNVIFKTCTKLPILKRFITDIEFDSIEDENIQRPNFKLIGAKFS